VATIAASMKGKRVVLTGASRGIGRETALALGKMGADVSLIVRDAERGKAVAGEVTALGGGGDVEVFIADLSSMADVRRVAAEVLAKHDRIDVLINNAGALLMDRQVTKDGYEATFATNHLGYFLLTKLLLDAAKKAPAGRIVNVASEAHHRGSMKFDDLMGEKKYAGWFAYSASKLANILFTAELARKLEGTKVTTSSLHPGVIASGFARNNEGVVGFLAKLASPFLMSPLDGARTTIFLATDPTAAGTSGLYFAKCKPKTPSREARDPAVAKRLWDVSEELVGK
jgi:retinol dehydrogenase 12